MFPTGTFMAKYNATFSSYVKQNVIKTAHYKNYYMVLSQNNFYNIYVQSGSCSVDFRVLERNKIHAFSESGGKKKGF